MSKKRAKLRNPVVAERLGKYAAHLGLEIVDYKHVTMPMIELAYVILDHLAERLSETGDDAGVTIEAETEMSISVRKLPEPSNTH